MNCPYKEKPCAMWDGECLAMTPDSCPHNMSDDVATITDWQLRQTEGEPQ